MSIESMKLAFESWARHRWTHREDFDQRIKAKPGTYNSFEVQAAWEAWQAALSQQPTTTEPVEDGIRNAEDELNCAEEVLDAITCEFSDGEFPVTDFNCIGDYITAVVDVFKERLAPQQPATGEPVVEPMALYNKVESKIVQRYVVEKRTGGGFWPYCVRACGGEREIFVGHKVACENVRAALQTACLDGAFMADIAARSHPAPSVPDEKPLPDLMMASYHEAIGWNACRAAMLAAKDSK